MDTQKIDGELLCKAFTELNIDKEYFSLFAQRANECFADLESDCSEPDNDEYSINQAKEFIILYSTEMAKGHCHQWAYTFARNIFEDKEVACREAYNAIEDPLLAATELTIHATSLNSNPRFIEYYKVAFLNCYGSNTEQIALDYTVQFEKAIQDGKTEIYAHRFADLYAEDHWDINYCVKYAEKYDECITNGKDEEYAKLYADKYGDGFCNYGEREDANIPEFWEEKVIGYMKGWEYARANNLKTNFADLYENIYLNAVYSDTPEKTPWDRLDEYVLEETLKKYHL